MDRAASELVAIALDRASERLVEVHWILTRRCQYSCWYCPPHRHDPKAKHAEESALLRALERVIKSLNPSPARINLTGGEPTLHPAVTSFVAAALSTEPIRFVRVVTNLAGPVSLFKRLAGINVRNHGLQVVASYHPNRAEAGPFMERVRMLASADVPVLIKVMGCEDDYEATDSLVNRLRQIGLPTYVDITVQAIRQLISGRNPFGNPLESEVLRRWNDLREATMMSGESILLDAEAVLRRKANQFRGWTCEVGSRSLFIDSDGSFHAALCRPHGEPLANVFDQSPLPVVSSVRCPHAVCGCASTVRIPKRAPESIP